jgi:hypothetical protein
MEMVTQNLSLVFLLAASSLAAKVDFASEINPIFVKHCLACHGGVKELGGMNFIFREQALGEGESGRQAGRQAIVPGHPEDSEFDAADYSSG